MKVINIKNIFKSAKQIEMKAAFDFSEKVSDYIDFIVSFQSFRKYANLTILDLFKLLNEYGTFSEVPLENLADLKFRFQTLLFHYDKLKISLQDYLQETFSSMGSFPYENSQDDLVSALYESKYNKLEKRLSYFEYVENLTDYISYYLMKRAS